ncbi:MAG TPA: MFS transporter [Paraburkholderia sp.]|nr:MFS transporter [Paraburkholderia sp.]
MNVQSETVSAPDISVAADAKRTSQSIVAATIGSTVETFDWMIYTTFAIYFAKQFFPSENSTASLLAAFAVFAIGFFARPVGGWLLGAFADRAGRRRGMMVGVWAMSASSFIIAVLPTYATIGMAAPILMTLARILQGLSVGGEYATATLFLAESAPNHKRGYYSSFQFLSVAGGILLASGFALIMTRVMTKEEIETWGWRIPFVIGGFGALIGVYMRRRMQETAAFEKARIEGRVQKRSPIWCWMHYPRATLRLVGVTILGAFSFYIFVSFIPVYAIHHAHADAGTTFAASTVCMVIFMVTQPLFGALSDRIGRRPQLIVFALGYLLFLYPVIVSIGTSFMSILSVELFGMLLYGLYTAVAPAVMVELFPTEVRGVGIGSTYNLIVALLGGTTPYLMTIADEHRHTGWFIAYVCFGALISLITYLKMPETRGIELSRAVP